MSLETEIPLFTVAGTARERGLSHGRQLQDRIRATYTFYEQEVFRASPLDISEIRQRAEQIRDIVAAFNAECVIEIDAIAEASGLAPWQLYALNARTEILNARVPECTALYFQQTRVLGQNWDWFRTLENLVVLIKYKYPNGRTLLTLTEPGMLAKIGLNNCGIGLCLNFLVSEHELDGVPVHVLTRAILEASDLAEARRTITGSGFGKSSHFLTADDQGDCYSIEFAGGNSYEVQSESGCLIHTNHCIAENAQSMDVPTSVPRLSQACAWMSRINDYNRQDMTDVLLDDSAGPESINAPYHPEAQLGGLDVGTCATLVMELSERRMHIKKGPGAAGRFREILL